MIQLPCTNPGGLYIPTAHGNVYTALTYVEVENPNNPEYSLNVPFPFPCLNVEGRGVAIPQATSSYLSLYFIPSYKSYLFVYQRVHGITAFFLCRHRYHAIGAYYQQSVTWRNDECDPLYFTRMLVRFRSWELKTKTKKVKKSK